MNESKDKYRSKFYFLFYEGFIYIFIVISIYNIISHFIHRTTGICTLLKIKSFPVSVEEILWNLAAY